MPIVVSVDLGTTKITSLAVDTDSGQLLAVGTVPNDANITQESDKARGYSEWDARRVVIAGLACLKKVVDQLGDQVRGIAGIGISGATGMPFANGTLC